MGVGIRVEGLGIRVHGFRISLLLALITNALGTLQKSRFWRVKQVGLKTSEFLCDCPLNPKPSSLLKPYTEF